MRACPSAPAPINPSRSGPSGRMSKRSPCRKGSVVGDDRHGDPPAELEVGGAVLSLSELARVGVARLEAGVGLRGYGPLLVRHLLEAAGPGQLHAGARVVVGVGLDGRPAPGGAGWSSGRRGASARWRCSSEAGAATGSGRLPWPPPPRRRGPTPPRRGWWGRPRWPAAATGRLPWRGCRRHFADSRQRCRPWGRRERRRHTPGREPGRGEGDGRAEAEEVLVPCAVTSPPPMSENPNDREAGVLQDPRSAFWWRQNVTDAHRGASRSQRRVLTRSQGAEAQLDREPAHDVTAEDRVRDRPSSPTACSGKLRRS